MSPDFSPAAARARGLTAHLFTRAELHALASHDAPGLTRALARSPKLEAPVTEDASSVELERALGLTARKQLNKLARWEGAAPVLGVFYAEQDRRSLRALLRGALASAPAEERLADLIPTPTLPQAVLRELARQPTPAAVASHLFVLRHPAASALLPLTAAAQPDLLALELALTRGYAERATAEARQGDDNLRAFVSQRLDAANSQTARVLSTTTGVEPERCFVEGGAELTLERFLALVAHPPVEAPVDPFHLALAQQRRAARLAPLSSAPVLLFLLRLEGQGRDLRRLIWGAALGAPAASLQKGLVTS